MRRALLVLACAASLLVTAAAAHAYSIGGRVETCPAGDGLPLWSVHVFSQPLSGGPLRSHGAVRSDEGGYWRFDLPLHECDAIVIIRLSNQPPAAPYVDRSSNGCFYQRAVRVTCNGPLNFSVMPLQLECGGATKRPCPSMK